MPMPKDHPQPGPGAPLTPEREQYRRLSPDQVLVGALPCLCYSATHSRMHRTWQGAMPVGCAAVPEKSAVARLGRCRAVRAGNYAVLTAPVMTQPARAALTYPVYPGRNGR